MSLDVSFSLSLSQSSCSVKVLQLCGKLDKIAICISLNSFFISFFIYFFHFLICFNDNNNDIFINGWSKKCSIRFI